MTASASPPVIFWFRSDLRLADNPALTAAVQSGQPVIPLYIHDTVNAGPWSRGAASGWWLQESLQSLAQGLEKAGFNALVLRRGDPQKILSDLIAATKATAVYWNRVYEPWATSRDTALKADLKKQGIEAHSFQANLLFEPWTVVNKTGQPYKVFTPFSKACDLLAGALRPPLPPVKARQRHSFKLESDDLQLLPQKDWYKKMAPHWSMGEQAAQQKMRQFVDSAVSDYRARRDFPGDEGVSRLSPHLHFGEISPLQVWHSARDAKNSGPFLRQLIWREFSNHLLYHAPDLPDQPWNRKFADFPWQENKAFLKTWTRGMTGYPIIDAGMRQLWQTGWMHNRVRMIVGSFLVKNLLQDWRAGERWFWDTLVDADLANNAASWQWVAGCGADAAPYFRIFNPILQSKKFDPNGDYIRRYVPELMHFPADVIHAPWETGAHRAAGYPAPMVDLAVSRDAALKAYGVMRDVG